jgi:pimeloyl-ACP methyl ester carboxylesterase
VRLDGQVLRVGRQAGSGSRLPLLLFNGIGGNIELLAPIARSMPGREVITFDVPGVGHSALPSRPYRLARQARSRQQLVAGGTHGKPSTISS